MSGWTKQLVEAVTTTGQALDAEGAASLGDFITNCMKDCTAGGKPPRAAHLVSELVWTCVSALHVSCSYGRISKLAPRTRDLRQCRSDVSARVPFVACFEF